MMNFFRGPSAEGKSLCDIFEKWLAIDWPLLFLMRFEYKIEKIRNQSRDLRRAQRDIERSKRDLEKQEKQLEIEIKRAAKEGNKQVCSILAKQLVQLRKQKSRFLVANSQISAVGNQSKVIQANIKLAGAISTTSKVSIL